MHEAIELSKTNATAAERKRMVRLQHALISDVGAMKDHEVQELYDWCESHLNGARWNTGGTGNVENMTELPAHEGEPGQAWERDRHTRTLYLGGREKVKRVQYDGSLKEEERDCVGLETARPWEEELPEEDQPTVSDMLQKIHTMLYDDKEPENGTPRKRDDQKKRARKPWEVFALDAQERHDSIWHCASDGQGYEMADDGRNMADPCVDC